MEITLFGRSFHAGFTNGNKTRQTVSTIISFPNVAPKASRLKPNEFTLRNFSRSAIPHRAISLLRDGVLAQNWRIAPVKAGDKRSYGSMIQAVENIIKNPNETDDYRSFWGQVINEVLIGDNGAAEIVFTGDSKQPMKLYPVNGFALEYVNGYFADPSYPRFVQKVAGSEHFLNDEDVLYIQHNKTADSPYGLSPLEAAFKQLDMLTTVEDYASKQASNALPKNALNLGENVSPQDLVAYRKYFEEEIYGTGSTPILGGTKGASALKIGAEGDAGLFLEWQKHLITIIALSFSVDPKKLGQGSNTDRSTVEEQNESMLNEAIRPLCLLLQDAINQKILGRLGLSDKLKFEFIFEDTLSQKQQRQEMIADLWNTNGITLKEYREMRGLPELKSPYSDMTQAEMKSAINKKYAVQQTGGFNGMGKDQKANVQNKTNGEKKNAQQKGKSAQN